MKNWKIFGLALGLTVIVGIQPVYSMANCVVGNSDRAEIPDDGTVDQNIFTSTSDALVLTVHTYTFRVIEGEPVSFKIRASVPPRSDLSVKLFIGIDNNRETRTIVREADIPSYIKTPYQRVSSSQLSTSLDMWLYEGLTVQFPAGQREHQFSLNTEVDPIDEDYAINVVLNPNTDQSNYEVDTSTDQFVAGAVIINKQQEFSISTIPGPAVNKGDCTKFRLSASHDSFTHRRVLLRYYGWYGDGTHRDEYALWVGIHDQIDVISTEPIPEYVSLSGIVVRVIDDLEYNVAAAPNNRAVINVNGLATGTIPSDAPVILVAATTTSVVEGQRANFLIGSEDISASSDINVNISVTTTGDFFENPVPSRFILKENMNLDNLYIETTDDNLDEDDGRITVKILAGTNYWVAPAIDRIASMEVKDNDQPVELPILEIGASRTSVEEGNSFEFLIGIENDARHQTALTININIEKNGKFFTSAPLPTTQIMRVGEDLKTIRVNTIPNSEYEPQGRAILTLLPGAGYNLSTESGNTVIVYINDKVSPTLPVIFAQSQSTYTEGSRITSADGTDTGLKPVRFSFIADQVTPTSQLTVGISITTQGSFNIFHLNNGVRQNSLPTSITFAADEDYTYIDLYVEDDDWYQEDGSITVTIKTGAGYIVANKPNNPVTVEIYSDDHLPTITTSGTQSIVEGASLVVSFNSNGKSLYDTQIHFQIDQDGSDFLIGSTLRTAVLPAKATTSSFRIVTLDDEEDEDHGELTILVLQDINNPPTYVVGESVPMNIMVMDNDRTVVGIYVEDEVDESAERLEFSIVSSSMAEVDLPISVTIESTDVINNLPRQEIVIIRKGKTSQNYVHTFENDKFDEVNETIIITIELNSELNVTTDALRRRATVRVIDDDDTPRISIEAAMESIIEGSVAIFNINSTGQSAKDIDIQLQITQNGDFILWRIPRAIKLVSPEMSVNLRIATKDNTITSNDGNITVEILDGAGLDYLRYLVDPDNKVAKIDFEDNDLANAPVVNRNSGPRISIASHIADALLRSSDETISNVLSGNPLQTGSSVAIAGDVEIIVPEISIEVKNEFVHVGEHIELIIGTSTVLDYPLAINLDISETGGYVHQLPTKQIKLETGNSSTKVTIPTIDSRQNQPGSLTVQIRESRSYIVGAKSEVSVTILGNQNEIRRREQFTAINESLIPQLLDYQGTDIFGSALDRTTLAFSNRNSDFNNFVGIHSFTELVKQSGEYLNTNNDTLKYLLANRAFSLELFPDDYSIIQTSLWGTSNFQKLSDGITGRENSWDGDRIVGQLGIDAKVNDNVLIGIGFSRSEADTEFDFKQAEKLDVFSQASILYPYFGLNVDEWDAHFRVTTGYGQMSNRIENSENISDERITNLMLTDFSASKLLYSDNVIGGSSTKSIAMKADTSLITTLDKEGQELGYNSEIGLMSSRLAAEGTFKVEFASDSFWHQLISIGSYAQHNNLERDLGLELKGESELTLPHGVELKNHGLLEFLNSDSSADWYFGGSIDFDENTNGRGVKFGLSALLEKNRKFGYKSPWNSGNIVSLRHQRTDDIDFKVNSTLGYGLKVFDEAAIITPFTDMTLTNENSSEYGAGIQFGIGSDLDLEFSVNQKTSTSENASQSYLFKGKIYW